MNNNRRKRRSPIVARISPAGAAAIVVIGIFVMCFLVIVSKSLFVSNSKTVAKGIDTATIGSTVSVSDKKNDSAADKTNATHTTTVSTTKKQTTTTKSETTKVTTSTGSERLKTLRVTYLKQKPDKNSEDVIVMSVGIVVDVLEELDSGWTKVTFLNVTGQLTGYIESSCLG